MKVAIIGRPNVGKSTLFNKLCRKRLAITHDLPGVTRDVKTYKAKLRKLEFELWDTAGMDFDSEELTQKMTDKSYQAMLDSDVVLFMVDGRVGVAPEDKEIARIIRKNGKETILVVNKAETDAPSQNKDFYKLGFKHTIFISSEHSLGFQELEAALSGFEQHETPEVPEEIASHAIKIAIVGKPNAGKSTLFNKLVGFDRAITSDVAGTTRDAITYKFDFNGTDFELIDTAGLRKKSKVEEASLEQLSSVESINAIRRSDLLALVIDAQEPLRKQDLSILHVALNEGKPAILVLNKMDLIEDRSAYMKEVNEYIAEKLPDYNGMPVIFISALKNKKFDGIFEASIEQHRKHRLEIPKNALNKWLEYAIERHSPPMSAKKNRIKLKYIRQTGIKPPTFTIFGNSISDLPESYVRYLAHSLRESFDIVGIPIRLKFRKTDNPFAPKS